jgi:hypothetical protein
MRLKVQRYGPGAGPGLTTFSFSVPSESLQRAMNLSREEQVEEPVASPSLHLLDPACRSRGAQEGAVGAGIEGTGHGAIHEHKRALDEVVKGFIGVGSL